MAEVIGVNKPTSRRRFLIGSAIVAGAVYGSSVLYRQINIAEDNNGNKRVVILKNAKGVLVSDPTRCVGCRRCELACTEFNDGRSSPTLSRIKVARNLNYGPQAVQLGFRRGHGKFGDFLVIQDMCKQCPHPVPCATACPYDAIEAKPPLNARVVNTEKCVGCEICQRACPWDMISFDEEADKATKCTLCDGNPQCVEACPTGSLRYVPWRDLTKDFHPRQAGMLAVTEECDICH
ncbi:MAG: 4Fe-4S dicluster domain-containing protein [Firmicutes bacterium]|nr:4Fe-4S dicluster domain-containing protein [Bacillota bacterium]